MEVWLTHKESGTEMGLNDDGELFIGNKESGGNAPDTLRNRQMFIRDFCRYTDTEMPDTDDKGKPISNK